MADYWVSQNRKYCDFCKCWITDNKPSVDFHEKGRRHQNNVQKRLKSITKQSAYNQKQSENFDATLKHIENAALNSYRKDVANNADLTSIAINQKLIESNLCLGESSNGGALTKLWKESRDKNGKVCYYNIMTAETVYTKPKEGFLTMKEQDELAFIEAKKQMVAAEKLRKKEGLLKIQEIQKDEAEEKARLAREKMKERRVVDDTPEPVYAPLIEPGPTQPYGRWEVIKQTEYIDLQLPEIEEYEAPPIIEYEPEPEVKEFKEKVVENLNEIGGNSTFKKRKQGFGANRNVRKRLDDD